MSELNVNWRPGFGSIITWYAMDRRGRIGFMTNNGFGQLPLELLRTENIDIYLDKLSEYFYEESLDFPGEILDVKGGFELGLYSAAMFKKYPDRSAVIEFLNEDARKRRKTSFAGLAAKKGLFLYEAIGGESGDAPLGATASQFELGDYFKFVIPTKFCSLENIPVPLRKYIFASQEIDFSEAATIDGYQIRNGFRRMEI